MLESRPLRIRRPGPLRLASSCLAVAVLVALRLPAGADQPAEPWDAAPFSAAPAAVLAAVAELPPPSGAEIEILLEEAEWELDAEGVVSSRVRKVYRVLERSGIDSWSSIEAWWSPWYEQRPELRARVILPDGTARELDPASTVESGVPGASADLYEDTRQLRAPLPSVTVGAVVETEVREHRLRPFFQAGETRRWLLSDYAPVRRSRAVIEAPSGLAFALQASGLGEPESTGEDGRQRIVYEATDLPDLADRESWLPQDDADLGPFLDFATGTSWGAVARTYDDIVEAALERTAGVDDLLDGLGEPGADRDGWLAGLLTRLHRRVRYTGVEFDQARLVPHDPALTLEHGYGDCKDKAALLVAALRAAGLDARFALLRSGFGDDVGERLPGLGRFDHAIVYLPGAPERWIDATDPYSAPGELPLADQGRLALVVAPGTTGLVRTPVSSAADNRTVLTRDVYLSELGKGRVEEESEHHGSRGRTLRARLHRRSREEVEELFDEWAQESFQTDVTSFETSEPDDLTVPLRVELGVEEVEIVVTDPGQALVGMRLAPLFDDVPGELVDSTLDARRGALQVPEPHSVEWRYRIHLPPGLAVRELPADAEDRFGPMVFSRHYEESGDGREVLARTSLVLDARLVSPEQVAEARAGIERLDAKGGSTALLWFDQTVQAEIAAGRLREAIAEAQRLIALHPEEAFHHIQLSQALLAGGLGAEARRAARRATEIETGSAAAWAQLGRTLLHDEVGRLYEPGYDRQGAIEALGKAAELDADDASIVADLAIANEHDAEGRRYAEGADLDAAIDAYRKVADELRGTELGPNLSIALLKAGRWHEALEEIEQLQNEASRSTLAVVATACADGPEAAVREAARRFQSGEPRSAALAQAGQELMTARRYPEAAELMRAAARTSASASALLSAAEVASRAVPFEELITDGDTPRSLFVAMMAGMLLAPDDEVTDRMLPLFAESIRRQVPAEELEIAHGGFPRLREVPGELPPEVIVDVAATALEFSERDQGRRVRIRGALGGEALDKELFLVRDEGRYRFLAFVDEGVSAVGLEALWQIERGDLDAAGFWLDAALDAPWYRGEVGDPLSGSVFPHFWSRDSPRDAETMRRAAAVLAAELGTEDVVEALDHAGDSGSTPADVRLELALLAALAEHDEGERVAEVAGRLHDRALEDGESVFNRVCQALQQVDRTAEIEAIAGERLALHPDDPAALRTLSWLTRDRGELDRANDLLDRLLDSDEVRSDDFNNAAWLSLARGRPPTPRDLDRARRAVEMSGSERRSTLHTLAALYAEDGKPAESYRLLLQSIEAKGGATDSCDLFVLGLLARAYGLTEAADRYLQRTIEETPDERCASATSCCELAQARLSTPLAAGDPERPARNHAKERRSPR